MNEMVKKVVGTDQDFEFYPTTNEILDVFYYNTDQNASILDIGAGNGKVLKWFKGDKYAIEKSRPLLDSLPNDVILVGVDFHNNTLIDKSVNVVFCNPPYSEYDHWATRIIKEANADNIFLVIPVRWAKSNSIISAIKDRKATSEVLGTFDFLLAEDRKARTTVNLVKISLGNRDQYGYVTPFAVFFKEAFGGIEAEKETDWEVEKQQKKIIETELIKSGDLITTLTECYIADMNKIERNYKAITALDSDILVNFDIDMGLLLKGLERKMKGLKNLYWSELFDRFDKVTDRLTSYARIAFLDKIFSNTSVDFTRQNIFAIADWVIRNANISFEDQILEFYERMLEKANCSAYKSNKKVFEQQRWGWDYDKRREVGEDGVFAKLSNRIILEHGIRKEYLPSGDNYVQLTDSAVSYFMDLSIIAEQLGFKITTQLMAGDEQEGYSFIRLGWHHDNFRRNGERGKKYRTFFEKNNKVYELYEAKMYKKGTIHIKFNQLFITKINVIYGRLKGWISNPQQAADELNISSDEAVEHFEYEVSRIGNDFLQLEVAK